VGSQVKLRGPDFPPVTMQYEHQIFMLHASDIAPLCSVYPQRWSLPQVVLSAWLLTSCSSATCRCKTLLGH